MKFEVEVISDGRCIIPSIDGTALIVADEELGGKLRSLQATPAPLITAKRKRGPNKRKALGKGITEGENKE